MTETRIIIRRSKVVSVRQAMFMYEQLCETRPLTFEDGASPHQALASLKAYINRPISIDVLVAVLIGDADLDKNDGVEEIKVFISELRVSLEIYVQLWHILHQHWTMTKETMIEALMDSEGLPPMPLLLPSASIIIE